LKHKIKKPAAKVKKKFSFNKEKIIKKVKEIAEPLCESEGIELVAVEFQREVSGRILRLYIDKPGGISLHDCTLINRQIGDLIDVYDDDLDFKNRGAYNLEVSSPGQNRPLSKLSDFERFKGEKVKIKTEGCIEGRKSFTGILSGVSENCVNLLAEEKTFKIPFQKITRANLCTR